MFIDRFIRVSAAVVSVAAVTNCGSGLNSGHEATTPATQQNIPTVSGESEPFLNMQPGDVLQKIDGQAVPDIRSPDGALTVYESLRGKQEVRVTVLRSGQTVEYIYSVK